MYPRLGQNSIIQDIFEKINTREGFPIEKYRKRFLISFTRRECSFSTRKPCFLDYRIIIYFIRSLTSCITTGCGSKKIFHSIVLVV